jgi:hypothetical protein
MPVTIKTNSGGGSVTLDSGSSALDTTLTLPNTNGTIVNTAPGASGNVLTSNGTIWTSAAPSFGVATAIGQVPFSTDGSTFTATQKIVAGTAVASTSGTSIDFTSIPSWVKRVTVMFNGVSTSGTSIVQVQLGSGSVTTSGYLGGYIQASSASAVTLAGLTTGFLVGTPTAANATFQGALIINLLSASANTWADIGNIADSTNQRFWTSSGTVSLSGALDRIRITTVNGTDTFDAGSINLLWE